MKYELLLFDADETLFDFSLSRKVALEKTFLKHKVDFESSIHEKKFEEISIPLWKKLNAKEISPEHLKVERFRQLLQHFNYEIDPELFSQDFIDLIAEQSHLIEGAKNLLSEIHKQCKIVIVTNGFKYSQNKRIRSSDISEYIDLIITPDDAGAAKPDRAILEYTFKVLNHNSKETSLIIGDSLTSDIQVGKNFGIDSCWYNPKKVLNETDIQPTYEISDLEELLTIV